MCKLRVILIGGSSHIGKSTLAESLAMKLGWRHISTDSLARHPGRPWRTKPESVPLHVAEHYLSLSADALIKDVLCHYRNMWPNVESIITAHATHHSTEQLILEGSALWPEFVATLNLDNVAAIWLTASNDFFQARIYKASQFEKATVQGKVMIQKFLERTHLYNEQMMDAIKRLGLVSINVETTASLNELSDICLEALSQQK
jgi:2-phosphoglycerate kinase